MAEAVTLAHVARPAVLANGLDKTLYDVVFACDPRYNRLFPELSPIQQDIYSIPGEQFVAALAKGKPVYSYQTLKRYVEDDLALIDRVKPDVVVGDFRLSLSVSARLSGVPYMTISNFYWSPLAQQAYPIPEHPLVAILGLPLAQTLFTWARPLVFALHTLPLNRVRRAFGLSSLGYDLRRAYTDSDRLLFADTPELAGGLKSDRNQRFIGPIVWSPRHELPEWWENLRADLPCIYITLGSSGREDLLPHIINTVKDLPVQLMVTTAGKKAPDITAENIFYADYLPGDVATDRASVLICNGGSLSTYQAMKSGVPVIGIAGNLDQHLNMTAAERLGMGVHMRNDKLEAAELLRTCQEMLAGSHNSVADDLQQAVVKADPCQQFLQVLEEFK